MATYTQQTDGLKSALLTVPTIPSKEHTGNHIDHVINSKLNEHNPNVLLMSIRSYQKLFRWQMANLPQTRHTVKQPAEIITH